MPLWVVLALAYLFEFANGWTDAPNSIATVVSTRVLRPFQAVLMAGALNLTGALVGTEVAKTIAKGIVQPDFVNLTTIGAAKVSFIAGKVVRGRREFPLGHYEAEILRMLMAEPGRVVAVCLIAVSVFQGGVGEADYAAISLAGPAGETRLL